MRQRGIGSPTVLLGIVTVALLLAGVASPVSGEEAQKDLPPRAISVAAQYTGVVVSEGEDISIDLIVTNGGRQDENVRLSLTSVPENWDAWIKTYSYEVTGVHLESDSSKTLTFKATPGPDVKPGEYDFRIKAETEDGELTRSTQIGLRVTAKEVEKKPKGVNIVTSYPVLRGPTDAQFEFSIEVENKLEKDTVFNLVSQGPKNWEVNFKPAYEDKFISSVRTKQGQTRSVAVEVDPYPMAEPGKYPVTVKVSAPEAEAEAELTVVLTGTHKLNMGTASGLLSLEAVRGEEANLSFYVQNSGSATLNSLEFLSFAPENWKVEFTPKKVDTLPRDEVKQVALSITPAEQALVGDYSVGVQAKSGKVNESMELRVTVKASTAWGWIGIGIIILVVAGLVVLFIRLGRR